MENMSFSGEKKNKEESQLVEREEEAIDNTTHLGLILSAISLEQQGQQPVERIMGDKLSTALPPAKIAPQAETTAENNDIKLSAMEEAADDNPTSAVAPSTNMEVEMEGKAEPSKSPTGAGEAEDSKKTEPEDNLTHVVCLECPVKNKLGLKFACLGELVREGKKVPNIVITRVEAGSPADGHLSIGDSIIAVNNIDVQGMGLQEVVDVLKTVKTGAPTMITVLKASRAVLQELEKYGGLDSPQGQQPTHKPSSSGNGNQDKAASGTMAPGSSRDAGESRSIICHAGWYL